MVADTLAMADSVRRVYGDGVLQITLAPREYKQLTKDNIKKLNDNHITVSKVRYTIRQRIRMLMRGVENG